MKFVHLTVAAAFSLGASVVGHRGGARFGPDSCVSVSQSPAGSCVISTNCADQDLSKVEFAFNCLFAQGGKTIVERHSFGRGGFDATEEFDTEVTCGRCAAPTSPRRHAVAKTHAKDNRRGSHAQPHSLLTGEAARRHEAARAASRAAAKRTWLRARERRRQRASQHGQMYRENDKETDMEESKEGEETDTQEKQNDVQEEQENTTQEQDGEAKLGEKHEAGQEVGLVAYGPKQCVSTYKDKDSSHCIMRTACDKADIVDYEFGLICVDKDGAPVRHLFGLGSFDPQETFDTLLVCQTCLGLEENAGRASLGVLAADITTLKTTVKGLLSDVDKLNKKVFNSEEKAVASSANTSATNASAPIDTNTSTNVSTDAPAPASPAPAPVGAALMGHPTRHHHRDMANSRRGERLHHAAHSHVHHSAHFLTRGAQQRSDASESDEDENQDAQDGVAVDEDDEGQVYNMRGARRSLREQHAQDEGAEDGDVDQDNTADADDVNGAVADSQGDTDDSADSHAAAAEEEEDGPAPMDEADQDQGDDDSA